jgi:hypothetical protein
MQVVKRSKIAASYQVLWYFCQGVAAYHKLAALALIKIWRS